MDYIDASVVLAPYLEPLVRGRRVVLLGDSRNTLGPGLIDRGARLVHVYDPDPVRAAEAAACHAALRSLVVARLPEGDLAVRDGAFDVVVVPDLSCFSAPDDIVRRASRLLAPTGAAVFAARNLEGTKQPKQGAELTYYELYDAVSLQFPEVRMLGQAPFVGYVIADFAPEDEPDVTVDTSLLEHGAEEPLWFLALASKRPARLDAYAIVQVPLEQANKQILGEAKGDSTALTEARARADTLEKELETERRELQQVRAQAPDPARVSQLEDQLKQSEARAGDSHVRAGRMESKVRELEEELRHQRERAFKLSRELDDEKKLRTKAELELGMMRRGSELPPKPLEAVVDTSRIEKLEADLGAALHKAARLERELAEALGRLKETQQALAQANDDLEDSRALQAQQQQHVRELQTTLKEREERIAQLDAAAIEAAQSPLPRFDEQLAEASRAREESVRLIEEMRTEQESEIARIEHKLVERAHQIEALRRDLVHRDQLVRELVVICEQAAMASNAASGSEVLADTVASLRTQLDRLASVTAERETELQATRWRVQELEGELSRVARKENQTTEVQELERALFAAQAELDALRRNQRPQGEPPNERLSSSQADLQQQAVLNAAVDAAKAPTPGPVDT